MKREKRYAFRHVPEPGFDFRTNDPDRDSVFAGVGVTAQIGNAWTASVFYYANFGNPTYASNMVSAGLNFAF